MNLLLTGATGLVGSALSSFLAKEGCDVVPLVRTRGPEKDRPTWFPSSNHVDLSRGGPFDAVVHLAGETIAQRWTPSAKQRIRDSRVLGTQLLVNALCQLPSPPKVLISASATGIYGDQGDEILDEQSSAGTGFLAEVAKDWESATAPAARRGIRVVRLRLGVVLTPSGGALQKMLPAFRLGLGGRIGNGRQYWSWIVLDDLLRIILHCLKHEELSGAVNAVAPEPVTNAVFTQVLGNVLKRPTVLPMPAMGIKVMLGQMGKEALLASTRVMPEKLTRGGFEFHWPNLESALNHLLKRDFD